MSSSNGKGWKFPKPPASDTRGYHVAFLWGTSRATWKVSHFFIALSLLEAIPDASSFVLQVACLTALCLAHPEEWDAFMDSDEVQVLS